MWIDPCQAIVMPSGRFVLYLWTGLPGELAASSTGRRRWLAGGSALASGQGCCTSLLSAHWYFQAREDRRLGNVYRLDLTLEELGQLRSGRLRGPASIVQDDFVETAFRIVVCEALKALDVVHSKRARAFFQLVKTLRDIVRNQRYSRIDKPLKPPEGCLERWRQEWAFANNASVLFTLVLLEERQQDLVEMVINLYRIVGYCQAEFSNLTCSAARRSMLGLNTCCC